MSKKLLLFISVLLYVNVVLFLPFCFYNGSVDIFSWKDISRYFYSDLFFLLNLFFLFYAFIIFDDN